MVRCTPQGEGCGGLMLHRLDAWHPSREGHQVLAEAAWMAVEPELLRLER
jgi:hypothetical protein